MRSVTSLQGSIFTLDADIIRSTVKPQWFEHLWALRKHAYSNILKISPPKKKSDKKNHILYISAQNIDCRYSLEPPRRGGSNEYPQSMFLNRNKKNNAYPVNPSFTI